MLLGSLGTPQRKPDTGRGTASGRSRRPEYGCGKDDWASDQLRKSKTFAAFRDHVHDYLLWVVVSPDDADAVADYERLLESHPASEGDLPDEHVEFLFRHVQPVPLSSSLYLAVVHNDEYLFNVAHCLKCHGELATLRAVKRFAMNIPLMSVSTRPAAEGEGSPSTKAELKRLLACERMARHRAAIKAMAPHAQQELRNRARASRTKYREQHRVLLLQKERARRQRYSRRAAHDSPLTVEEYLRRRRIRESGPSYLNYQRQTGPALPTLFTI
ncbi:hypothetical protein C8F04DRAFT_1191841 [Mycena alexandri]|uniref:Uncharacterized protein n=1 Tax=Mycena alexandri TaxID=1745969 RepID=A0AAD6WS35_9AGAR|nr:hypothetical protein C8F04DRAFT_1191841 [Mycena alexandri]